MLPAILLVFVATFAAYWPAVGAGYVWNDPDYVTKPALRSLAGLGQIWFQVGATEQYYPVLHSVFWVEHRLWGDAASGYHIANILLHATSACLLALVLRRLSITGAWLAAFIFALHPVCVESVAWISEQKNTLSTVFYLMSALTYLRWRGGGMDTAEATARRRPYWLATAFFTLAILSKSMAATLPAALLVVLWWKRGRISWRGDVVPLLPWFVLAAAGGLFTGWVERKFIGAEGSDFSYSILERTLIAGRSVVFYLGKLVWPRDLIFIYPRWRIDSGVWWQHGFPLGVLAFTALLWSLRGRSRAPLAAWLLFVGSLFPILGFLNVYAFVFSFVADHWQYLASLGVFSAVAAGLTLAWGRVAGRSRAGAWTAAAVLLIPLGILTWAECRSYHDAELFYRTILARNPACWMAHNNLGMILENSSRRDEALVHFEEAVRLRPDYIEGNNNLGACLSRRGRVSEAIPHYRKAIRLFPRYVVAHTNLGAALAESGKLDEAIAEYNLAKGISPRDPEVRNNLAVDLLHAGRADEARTLLKELLQIQPDYVEGWFNLGVVSDALGNQSDSIRAYGEAIRLNPGHADARNNLGNVLLHEGRIEEAMAQYRKIIEIKPDYGNAYDNLGHALAKAGRTDEAMEQFRTAKRLNPNAASGFLDSGTLLAKQGKLDEALGDLEHATRLDPRNAEAHNNYGGVLYMAGRREEAGPQFREAIRLKPGYTDAHKNLGVLLEAQGRKAEARAEFEIVQRLQSPK